MQSLRPRVIAGFGRSGTTWVQDVLATSNSLRAVFEPLHPQVSRQAETFAHAYRTAEDEDAELVRFLNQYFFENYHSLWSDYRTRWDWLFPLPRNVISFYKLKRVRRQIVRLKTNFARFHAQRRRERRIVKFVRANMLLAWLKRKYDARIVFVIRHPAAVILSQLSSPHVWNPRQQIDSYRTDSRLLEILSRNTQVLLNRSLNDVEALTLSWCIENEVAMRQARAANIPIVHYENLLRNGKSEWEKVLSTLELRIMPDEALISQPSQQAWGDRASDPELVRQYASWMERIDKSTARQVQNVLDLTETDTYCVDNALPKNSYCGRDSD